MTTFSSPSSSQLIDIIVASGNPGKLVELRELLGSGYRIRSAGDVEASLPEETGTTFAENAILKASSVARQTGCIAIADDSGLVVDVLEGAPGVYSARYAGLHATDEENRTKLLNALVNVGKQDRSARFVSVIAIAFGPEDIVTAEGSCDGVITRDERGCGGFGYDPIFQTASGQTMAELTSEQKNAISHRGHAMKKATFLLEARIGSAGVSEVDR